MKDTPVRVNGKTFWIDYDTTKLLNRRLIPKFKASECKAYKDNVATVLFQANIGSVMKLSWGIPDDKKPDWLQVAYIHFREHLERVAVTNYDTVEAYIRLGIRTARQKFMSLLRVDARYVRYSTDFFSGIPYQDTQTHNPLFDLIRKNLTEIGLGDLEVSVLKMRMDGWNLREVSQELGRSYDTVEYNNRSGTRKIRKFFTRMGIMKEVLDE